VAVAKDDMIRKKNREPIHGQEYRKIMISSLKMVDLALSGFENPEEMIGFIGPDVIAYGYDQNEFLKPDGIEIIKVSKKIDDSKFKTKKILGDLGL